MAISTASYVGAVWGGVPVSISNKIAPTLNKSVRPSMSGNDCACSGDM